MQEFISIEEVRRQVLILRRNYRVNVQKNLNGDFQVYVMKNSDVLAHIEVLFNSDKNHYVVDWVSATGKMLGKGKLLYYMAMDEAFPRFLSSGIRTNQKANSVWDAIEKLAEKGKIVKSEKGYKLHSKIGE